MKDEFKMGKNKDKGNVVRDPHILELKGPHHLFGGRGTKVKKKGEEMFPIMSLLKVRSDTQVESRGTMEKVTCEFQCFQNIPKENGRVSRGSCMLDLPVPFTFPLLCILSWSGCNCSPRHQRT